jgi:hypothetical protein
LEIFEGYLKIGDSSNTGYGIALERNSATVGNINTANNRINIQSSNNRDVELRDTSGNNLILKHGGNVGIGTDIPTTKLTIQNTNSLVNFGNIQTTFSSSGTSGVPDVLIKDKDNSSTRAALQIQGNNGAQEVLFAASSGHVGIGTVSPGERLEVVGNISASGAIDGASLDINGAADIAGNLVLSAGALSITGDGSNATTFTESGNGDFTIVSVDDIRLTAGGNDIVLRGASSAEFGRLSNSSQDFVIQNVTSNKDIIFAGNDGGSTIQALTLDISDAGSATFNNHITASGNISASGNITANSFVGALTGDATGLTGTPQI